MEQRTAAVPGQGAAHERRVLGQEQGQGVDVTSSRGRNRALDHLRGYAVAGSINAQMSILVDPLSILMMGVVTGVSTLIHAYSIAYMGGDKGYSRFFAYLNFFVFSMLLLVLAANFLLLIVGWAFVGAGAAADLLLGTAAPRRPRRASRPSSSTSSATSA